MEFRQLKYFLAVIEEGQITKAAKRLHITQPPLSQQIILLEKELGVQLIRRTRKNIQLTEAGALLQNRAEQIMELMKAAVTEMQEVVDGTSGKLIIGTITSAGRSLIPEYIKKYHQIYPKVSFELRQGDTRKILELLDADIIEFGIVRLPINSELYNSVMLPDECMVAVASSAFQEPPASAATTLEQLRDKPLLIHRRHKAMLEEHCYQAGFEPIILCESDDITPLLIWADIGIGIAIVPESSLHFKEDSTLIVRKIMSPVIKTTSAIVWQKKQQLSLTAKHFIEMFG